MEKLGESFITEKIAKCHLEVLHLEASQRLSTLMMCLAGATKHRRNGALHPDAPGAERKGGW
jgi:hypothetical protein